MAVLKLSPHQQIAGWLATAKKAVVFTGAGISTESGVPDFRSPNGIWATSTPVDYNDFIASEEARHEYWRQKSVMHRNLEECTPNSGHEILARWESQGLVRGVITQNIDGFHQLAGSRKVLELHGTAREVACLACTKRYDAGPLVSAFEASQSIPPCPACGSGYMKHATISFGQSLDWETHGMAIQWSRESDLFLVLGSSLVVHPAASLPIAAQREGARLVIVNREPTPLDDLADLLLQDALGVALAGIDAALPPPALSPRS